MGMIFSPKGEDTEEHCKSVAKAMRPAGLVEQYIGSSYDIVKRVHDELANIILIGGYIETAQGPQGDTATVVDNLDGTYTIAGQNGSVTVSDGANVTVVDNGGGSFTFTDGEGTEVTLIAQNIHEIQEYSIDGISLWHTTFVDGDEYKRVATVTNTVAGAWSTAYKIVGTSGSSRSVTIEYEYSADDANWHTAFADTDYFRRQRTSTDTDGTVVNSNWTTGVRIRKDGVSPVKGIDFTDGLSGTHSSTIFQNAPIAPPTPIGGAYTGTVEIIPAGWADNPTTPTGTDITWASRTTYTDTGSGWVAVAWSTVVRFSGADGSVPEKGVDYFDGISGKFTSYIYLVNTVKPAGPIGGTFDGTTETLPTLWSDDPIVPTGTETLWISSAVYSPTGSTWTRSTWAPVTKFSALDGYTPQKGVDYFDGFSAPYNSIIYRTDSALPLTPTGGAYTGTSEVIPMGWVDEVPITVPAGDTIYFSTRKYTQEVSGWVANGWSVPVEFSGLSTGIDDPLADFDIRDFLVEGVVDVLLDLKSEEGVHQAEVKAKSDKSELAAEINVVRVASDKATADISTISTAYVDADVALAQRVTITEATMGTNAAGIVTVTQSVATETTARVDAIAALTTTVGTNTSSISTVQTAISDETTARVNAITSLNATVGTNTGNITTNAQAIVDEAGARVIAVSTVSASASSAQGTANQAISDASSAHGTANGAVSDAATAQGTANSASVTAGNASSAVATLEGDLVGKYVMGVDVSGNFTGISVVGSGSDFSEIKFKGATFKFVNDSNVTQLSYGLGNWNFSGTMSVNNGAFAVNSLGLMTSKQATISGLSVQANSANTGVASLQVTAANSSQACTITQSGNGTGLYVTTATGTGIYGIGTSRGVQGNASSGSGFDFYAVGAGANYGPFTAGHDGLVLNDEPEFIQGDLMADYKILVRANISNALGEVRLTKQPMQRGVRGVYVGRDDMTEVLPAALRSHEDGFSFAHIYDHITFNSIGDGLMNVCGEGGDLIIGSQLCSSSMIGKAMAQLDQDNVKPYTVAESRENITFSSPTEVKQIAVIYRCG